MRYEEEENRVYRIIEFPNGFIKEGYGMILRTRLAYTGTQVTASIYNYLDEIQTNYAEPIIFDYEGSQITATPINGVASIDFTSTVVGEHIVRTVNPNMRNGEVKIIV